MSSRAIDIWFIDNIEQLVEFEKELKAKVKKFESKPICESKEETSPFKADLLKAKQWGFSDYALAKIFDTDENTFRNYRKKIGILPTYQLVDTCSAEY